jgi:hypothetical protein
MSHIRYTNDQRQFILLNWNQLKRLQLNQKEKLRSFGAEFEAKFPGVPVPSKATIFRVAQKFSRTNSVANKKRNVEKTAVCPENVQIVA